MQNWLSPVRLYGKLSSGTICEQTKSDNHSYDSALNSKYIHNEEFLYLILSVQSKLIFLVLGVAGRAICFG